MKKVILAILTLTATLTAYGETMTIPGNLSVGGELYLSDDATTPVSSRIPSGTGLGLDSSVITPYASYYELQGTLRCDTNRSIIMRSSAGGTLSTGVHLNAESGTLTLRSWNTGTSSWDEKTFSANGDLSIGTNSVTIYDPYRVSTVDLIYMDDTRERPTFFGNVAGNEVSYENSGIKYGGEYVLGCEDRALFDDTSAISFSWGESDLYANKSLNMSGNDITNATYYGDGSHLTGITSTSSGSPVDSRAVTNNIDMSGYDLTVNKIIADSSVTNDIVISPDGAASNGTSWPYTTGQDIILRPNYTGGIENYGNTVIMLTGDFIVKADDPEEQCIIFELPSSDPGITNAFIAMGQL